MTTADTMPCSRCHEDFPLNQLYAAGPAGSGMFACTPCGEAMKHEAAQRRTARDLADRIVSGGALVTADTILAHLAHPVADAPHLVVCTCGETFRSIPNQSGPFEQWAAHLADTLSRAVTA